MKYLFTFLTLILLSSSLFSQTGNGNGNNPCTDDVTDPDIILDTIIIVDPDSIYNGDPNGLSDSTSVIYTGEGLEPFVETQLEGSVFVKQIELTLPDGESMSNFYVLIGTTSFIESGRYLSELFSSAVQIHHFNFNVSGTLTISVNENASHIRIQGVGQNEIILETLGVLGEKEICCDGEDNDCDGLIDCDDSDCSVEIANTYPSMPNCYTCMDGEINVWAFGEALNYSFDGGLSFQKENIKRNLDFGDYMIVVTSDSSCCSDTVWVTLESYGNCYNSGFEDGNWDNWFGIGSANGNPPNGFSFYQFSPDEQFVDYSSDGPTVLMEIVENYYDTNGIYISGHATRLNWNYNNGDGTKTAFKYEFIVDSDINPFGFRWAAVLQDPLDSLNSNGVVHADSNRPYFYWEIGKFVDSARVILHSRTILADIDDPSLTVKGNGITVKNWTCESIDLSANEGDTLFIYFQVNDCSWGEHMGYAYIDDLCSSPDDLRPVPCLNMDSIYCINQDIVVDGRCSQNYVPFEFEICELNTTGGTVVCYTKSGFNMIEVFSLDDFLVENGNGLKLNTDYRIILTLSNECITGEYSDTAIVKLIDESNNVEYDDILWCRSSNYDYTITGVNDCNNCSINWEPYQFLDNRNIKYPTIMGTTNIFAFEEDYFVTVVNEYGCHYRDTVEIFQGTIVNIEVIDDSSYCEIYLLATLNTTDEIDKSTSWIRFTNLSTTTFWDGTIISESYNSNTNRFEYVVSCPIGFDKGEDYDIKVDFNMQVPNGLGCVASDTIQLDAQTLYFESIQLWTPNVFSPNGDGDNDYLRPSPQCQIPNGSICPPPDQMPHLHNAYEAEMWVWGRGSNGQFSIEFFHEKIIEKINGPIENCRRLSWDGNDANGNYAPQDAYLLRIEAKNCSMDTVIQHDVTLLR